MPSCIYIIQGNVMIVDTPGFGNETDEKEKDVKDKIRSYLPNAVAFVFVVNVSNAGGLQTDRVLRIRYVSIQFDFQ